MGVLEPLAVWAQVDDEDVLRLRFAEPGSITRGSQLALRRRHRRDEDFRLAAVGSDTDQVTVDLAALELTQGRWDVYLLAPGEVGRGACVRCTDPGHTLDGLLEYAQRRRGFALRAYRTLLDGHLAVCVVASPPHAELQILTLTDDDLVVEGVLAYTGRESEGRRRDAGLVAVLRGAGGETEGEAVVDGLRFSGRLPLGVLADVAGQGDWDVWLQLGADEGQDGVPCRLRLSCRLDGLADKAERIRYPGRCVHRGSDLVSVRPCHPPDTDDLAIAVRPVAEVSEPK